MAIIGNIAIGMSVGTGAFTKGLGTAKGALKGFADSILSIQGLAAGVLGGAASASVFKLAGQFAHLSEATSKVDAVFGKQAETVKASAKAMADAYGMSLTDIYDKQSMLGASLTGVGFSEKAAANYSDVFVRLANDMTRRWDVEGGMSESIEKIMGALRGSQDSLEKYGVTFNENTVAARAYSMGLAKVGQELSEAAKKQARASIVLEQMKSSIGAAASEAGSFGGNVEALSGRWENFTTTLGEVFAPTLGTVMGDLGVLLKVLKDGWEDNRKGVEGFATQGLGGLEGFATGVGVVQGAVMKLVDGWQVLKLSFLTAQQFINSRLIDLIRTLGDFKAILDEMSGKNDVLTSGGAIGLLTGRKAGGGDFFAEWADGLERANGAMLENLKAEWAKPWSSEGFSAAFAKARGQITELQQQLAGKSMALDANTGAKGTATKLVKEGRPYAAAVLAGGAEAQKAVARVRGGLTGTDVAKNTAATVKRLDRLVKIANDQLSAKNIPIIKTVSI